MAAAAVAVPRPGGEDAPYGGAREHGMTEKTRVPIRLPLLGGCQCGGRRYAVRAMPLTLYACHCTECQAQSSSAFGLSMLVRRADLETDWSQLGSWARHATLGGALTCHFCPDCGSRLFHAGGDGIVSVKAGSLDDRSWLDPVGHMWTRSAQPWMRFEEGALLYETSPADMAPLENAFRDRMAGRFTGP